jgi:uncharacterized protein (TIGR00369 family)
LNIPEGFRAVNLTASGFITNNGPLFARREEDGNVRIGLRVEDRHCNPVGMCHGGMLATLADMVLGFGVAAQAKVDTFMPTISLTCDYLAPAHLGAWIEGTTTLHRKTRNLAFGDCLLTADGEPCLRANGIFKIPSSNPANFSLTKIFG